MLRPYYCSPKKISGVKCFPEPERKEDFCAPCWVKDTFKNIFFPTKSAVNMVMREYTKDEVDISVQAPGGALQIKRWFYDNRWWFDFERHGLVIKPDATGEGIEGIEKGGVTYEKSASDPNRFTHALYTILKTAEGFRWEDTRGNWKDYDADGNLTQYGDRIGTRAALVYTDGRLTSVADRNGRTVFTIETDGSGRITAVDDLDGRRVAYTYAGGRLTRVLDVRGKETAYGYDGESRLTSTTTPDGEVTSVDYDKYGNPASVTNSRGEGWTFEYDYDEAKKETYARVVSTTGATREFWFDRDGESYRVDLNGRTIQKIAKDGRHLLITDENNRVTRKEFNEWDNVTRIVYPDGSEVNHSYAHSFNRRTETVDENGIITRFAYDANGNMVSKTEAADTDQERITEYAYDADGNLTRISRLGDADTALTETVLAYDTSGNMTSVTDPEGGITRFTHDAMGNVLTREDPRGKVWIYAYDEAGNLTTVTDPLNQVTTIAYDDKGRKFRQVDPANKETRFGYDEDDNLVTVTDHEGNVTRMEYNRQ